MKEFCSFSGGFPRVFPSLPRVFRDSRQQCLPESSGSLPRVFPVSSACLSIIIVIITSGSLPRVFRNAGVFRESSGVFRESSVSLPKSSEVLSSTPPPSRSVEEAL